MSVLNTSTGNLNFVTNFYNSTVVSESLRHEQITICKDAINVFYTEKSIATVANLIGRVSLLAIYHIPIASLIAHTVATFFGHEAIESQLASPAGQPATELTVTIMTPSGTRPSLELLDSLTILEVIQSFANAQGEDNSRLSLFYAGEEEQIDKDITLKEFMQARNLSGINLDFFALARRTEKEILLSLVKADGPWAKTNLNWDQETDIAQWDGVTLNEAGQVIGLDVSYQFLSGPIPPQLEQLTALKGLNLGHNQLTGPIPPQLGQLAELEDLYLNNNQLTGPIPHQLGDLSKLQGLSLENNQLTGPIPPDLGQLTALETLHLRYNQLTGPIPHQLGELSNLQRLNLGHNQLTGPIPHQLGDLSKLQGLGLNHNQLTDPIPPQLGQLAELEDLYLNNNQLTGPIPPELEARRGNGLYVAI